MGRVENVAYRENVGVVFRRPAAGSAESTLSDGEGVLCAFARPPPTKLTGVYRRSVEG
jgi:hypothetical protein